MRWMGRRGSGNVEDRRGMPVGGMAIGGGLGSLVLIVVLMLMGVDPGALLNQAPPGQQQFQGNPADEETKDFVAVVLADTEDVWHELFRREFGRDYREPKLVLFTQQIRSACGFAGAAVGPFYCPADQKVYLDLSFFDQLRQQFRAPGDFAAAYVIAHEVGHHVQNQAGVFDQVERARSRLNESDARELSVRTELQADFLAGVWAHHAQQSKQILEAGDVDEAMQAASAVGDDRIQRQTRGYVVPDSFTHGTSQQRARWFGEGFQSGDLSRMNELFERPYDEL